MQPAHLLEGGDRLSRVLTGFSVEVLDQPGLDAPADLVQALPRERKAALLSGMSADRAADLFRQLKEPARSELLGSLDPETRTRFSGFLPIRNIASAAS
jgi:Mg/Co/Ni transporter MgtE